MTIYSTSSSVYVSSSADTVYCYQAKTPVSSRQISNLPLKLIAFNGLQVKDIISLNWATVTEKNVNHFELEESINGIHFKCINKQTAKGITKSSETYRAEDFKPSAGKNFYRLKIVSNNGKITYSTIITVSYKLF